MTCKHDIAEQDTYVADGYCPLCLLDQIQRLQARVDQLEQLRKNLSWLCGEVERDHELGRLSVDSEDCAKACRESMKALEGEQ